jgi:hypothetical protein
VYGLSLADHDLDADAVAARPDHARPDHLGFMEAAGLVEALDPLQIAL